MKDKKISLLHPYIRIVFFLLGSIGTFLSTNLFWLFSFEVLLLPIIYFSASIKLLGSFFLIVVFPMVVMQYCFYASQNQLGGGHIQELLKISKLILYTSIMQIFLLIPIKYVSSTFKAWGFTGEPLLIVIGSYFLWFDVVKRSEQVLLARLGSGYIYKRTFLSKMAQIPFVLVPVVTGVLKAAVIRSESWKQKDIIKRVEYISIEKIRYPLSYNLAVIGLSIGWFVINIVN